MFMSESEIVSRYRQAKSKTQQITILAQINMCDRSDIIELLALNGEYYRIDRCSQRWNAEECDRLEQMFDRNMTIREIAAIYGCKPSVMASTVTYLRSQGKLQRRISTHRGRPAAQLQTA